MAVNYVAEIEHRVAGIPCLIGVIDYESYTPAFISGPPDSCYPAEGGSGEWEILDRRGRPAAWLQRKLTPRDEDEINEVIFNHMEN